MIAPRFSIKQFKRALVDSILQYRLRLKVFFCITVIGIRGQQCLGEPHWIRSIRPGSGATERLSQAH